MPLISKRAWTGIWVIPFGNLLGLSLLVLMFVPVILIAVLDNAGWERPPSPWRPLALLFPVALFAAAAIDFRWRLGQRPMRAINRWLSPYEGATIVAFPIWLISGALLLMYLGIMIRKLGNP